MVPESLRRPADTFSSRRLDELRRVLAHGDLSAVKSLSEPELQLLRHWLGGEDALQRYLGNACES